MVEIIKQLFMKLSVENLNYCHFVHIQQFVFGLLELLFPYEDI